MTENEKQEAFDRWYGENYDEWAEVEEGIALREELEQAFKSGIAELEKENAELRNKVRFMGKQIDNLKAIAKGEQLTKAKVCLEQLVSEITVGELEVDPNILQQAEQFLSEVEK